MSQESGPGLSSGLACKDELKSSFVINKMYILPTCIDKVIEVKLGKSLFKKFFRRFMKNIKGIITGMLTVMMITAASGLAFADNFNITWMDADSDGVSEPYYFNVDGTLALASDWVDANGSFSFSLGDTAQNGADAGSTDAGQSVGELTGSAEASISTPIVDVTMGATVSAGQAEASVTSANTAGRKDIVDFARQYVGVGVLRYGTGNSLSGPADCSGFTQAVYKTFGISLPRSSREQAASAPRYVTEAEMLPGDLIFYGGNIGSVRHVAIYTGDNSIVRATNSSRGWVFEDSGSSAIHYENIAAIGRYW
jgi:cell wall-associated NlpC family hydrolase